MTHELATYSTTAHADRTDVRVTCTCGAVDPPKGHIARPAPTPWKIKRRSFTPRTRTRGGA